MLGLPRGDKASYQTILDCHGLTEDVSWRDSQKFYSL
jgi:hypothetical protein